MPPPDKRLNIIIKVTQSVNYLNNQHAFYLLDNIFICSDVYWANTAHKSFENIFSGWRIIEIGEPIK